MTNVPAPTPNLSQSLAPQDLPKHRAMIGLEVTVVLDGYWKDHPAQAVKDRILADWMDTLQDWHLDQIKHALRKWRNANPSKKPNPGHILSLLKEERGMYWAGRSDDPVFAISRSPVLAIQ